MNGTHRCDDCGKLFSEKEAVCPDCGCSDVVWVPLSNPKE